MTVVRRFVLFCVCICIMFSGVQAQESGTIQAIATVVSSLQVIGINNLNFGTVTPGINKTVDKAEVGFAGEWQINGTASAEVTIDFTLPVNLITTDSVSTLQINFNTTDASFEDGTGGGQTIPAGVINPRLQSVEDIGLGGTMSVWIGGQVQPTISQTGGDYAADVVMTVSYTGN
ncbi:MAG: hypothetical protein KAR42_02530 [candidate division Zixibacteria bacterium]|nr:hypothetical protein [candidate division Zixibacteria bacterium]